MMAETVGSIVARLDFNQSPPKEKSLDQSIPSNGPKEASPILSSKDQISEFVQEAVGQKVGRRLGDQEIEVIRALIDVGDNNNFIAELLGRGRTTIAAHRRTYETSVTFGDDPVREEKRGKFITKAYELVYNILDELNKDTRLEGAKFDKLATTLGIVMDKILLATARFDSCETHEGQIVKQVQGLDDDTLRKFASSAERILRITDERKTGKDNSRQSEREPAGSES